MGLFGLGKPNVERMLQKRNVKGLCKALSNDDAAIRRQAVRALHEIADPRGAEHLARALLDDDPEVKEEVSRALFELGPNAVEALVEALRWSYRAAEILGRMGDPRAVKPLLEQAPMSEAARQILRSRFDVVLLAFVLTEGALALAVRLPAGWRPRFDPGETRRIVRGLLEVGSQGWVALDLALNALWDRIQWKALPGTSLDAVEMYVLLAETLAEVDERRATKSAKVRLERFYEQARRLEYRSSKIPRALLQRVGDAYHTLTGDPRFESHLLDDR